MSSYQLENYENLVSEISVFTSLTSNHLERYPSLQDYYKTKWFLAQRAKSYVLFNLSGGDLQAWVKENKNLQSLLSAPVWTDRNDPALKRHALDQALLLGQHNQDNLAIAAKVCDLLGWSEDAILALKKNPGLQHRLENLGLKSGVLYINDSKATTIESVETAISSLLSIAGDLHVLLGGRDKNLPWSKLSRFTGHSKIHFYFFGECAKTAQESSQLPGLRFQSLGEALTSNPFCANPGDFVLLSPGGTSLDEFKNFEARGNFFKTWFNTLS